MVKAQPSLFVFNKNSHLEGIMHYNTTLNNAADWKLEDAQLVGEVGLEGEDYDIEGFEDNEEEFDFDDEDTLDAFETIEEDDL